MFCKNLKAIYSRKWTTVNFDFAKTSIPKKETTIPININRGETGLILATNLNQIARAEEAVFVYSL